MQLAEHVALITGSARGIGRATARRLAQRHLGYGLRMLRSILLVSASGYSRDTPRPGDSIPAAGASC